MWITSILAARGGTGSVVKGGVMCEAAYYSRRAQQEREAAMKAADEKVRAVHLELAAAYDARVGKLRAKPRSTLHIVTAA